MAEEVSTGGLVRFKYGKDSERSKLGEEQRNEIRGAYAAAERRKAMEKRNKIIIWVIIGLIILAGVGWLLLR